MLSLFNLLLLAYKFIIFLKLFKLVTFVITSCILSVVCPVIKTDPTEGMIARSASHMIASLVFLYLSLTFGTRFRVCNDPLEIWTFSGVLFLPLLRAFTVCRLMRLHTTKKTKGPSTIAFNICCNGVNVFLITKLTTFHRAPFNALVIVCVRFTKPFPVPLKHLWLWSKKCFENTVANLHVAPCLHASCVKASEARIKFFY
jgi:hypothetical protein